MSVVILIGGGSSPSASVSIKEMEAYLHSTLSEELVPWSERDLNHSSQFGELLGGVGLDVSDSLEVGCASLLDSSQLETFKRNYR